ncbi:alpha/beta hydrolase [Mycolicibacterium sp.]|uniref:alpha/beta hydrolase n=1 Tax=Mycolicibacterium sp. TaxID=2320850 RepID=UPI003D0E4115
MTVRTTAPVSAVRLKTADGAFVAGVLRIPSGGAATVVSIMHPREDVTHHPLVDAMLESGVAVWTQGTRSVNNDVRLLHEQALLDVAAGQAFLEEQHFDARVTLGHSGGATLFAFYQQQAALSPEHRLTSAPDGTATDLASARMPVPHGAVFMAPHPGQGVLLQRVIDPSVIDESDPFSTDPDLDPYNSANGFRPAPEPSRYSPEFVERYRAAQVARVRRLDAVAADVVAAAQRARQEASATKDVGQRRRSLVPSVMVVHRTDADLRSVDLSLDPNRRPYGSLFGRRPDLGNFGFPGFCRITTPSAWLSTWSATTSRANFVANAPGVSSPTLLVELTGDQACFPSDAARMYGALGASDKVHVQVAGTHFGGPIAPGEPTGTELAAAQITRWLRDRFDMAG